MADIQSVAAEIRRGKKRRKNKLQHENMWSALFHRATIITTKKEWLRETQMLHRKPTICFCAAGRSGLKHSPAQLSSQLTAKGPSFTQVVNTGTAASKCRHMATFHIMQFTQ